MGAVLQFEYINQVIIVYDYITQICTLFHKRQRFMQD